MFKRIAMLAAIVILTSGFIGGFSSSKPESWKIWEKHNPGNTQVIDHSKWDTILNKYIITDETGLNLFAYGDVTDADNALLTSPK